MNKISKFLKDNYEYSEFVVAKFMQLNTSYVHSLMSKSIGSLPPTVADKISRLEEYKDKIDKYYEKQVDFINNTIGDKSLKEFINDLELSAEDISNETLVDYDLVSKAIESGSFKTNNSRDLIYDYLMWVYDIKQNSEDTSDTISEIPQIPQDTPEESIPNPECNLQQVPDCNENIESYMERISGLNGQLDWYEQIIDTFSKLAELATRNK